MNFFISAATTRKVLDTMGIDLAQGVPKQHYASIEFYESVLHLQYPKNPEHVEAVLKTNSLPAIREQFFRDGVGKTEKELMEALQAIVALGGNSGGEPETKSQTDAA